MAHVLRRLASPPGRLAKQCLLRRGPEDELPGSTISPGDATSWNVLGHFICPCGRKITAGYPKFLWWRADVGRPRILNRKIIQMNWKLGISMDFLRHGGCPVVKPWLFQVSSGHGPQLMTTPFGQGNSWSFPALQEPGWRGCDWWWIERWLLNLCCLMISSGIILIPFFLGGL